MRERKLTTEADAHIFELAQDLGIGARRATEIRHEIERTKGRQ